MLQVVEVAEERRRAHEGVEVLRVADVARVHDDERLVELLRRAPTSLSRGCGVIALVSTQFGITARRSGGVPFSSSRRRIVSPIATTRSARLR